MGVGRAVSLLEALGESLCACSSPLLAPGLFLHVQSQHQSAPSPQTGGFSSRHVRPCSSGGGKSQMKVVSVGS